MANITNHYKEHGYKVIKSSKICLQCVISGGHFGEILDCSQGLQSLSPGSVADQTLGNICHLSQVLPGGPQVLPGLGCRHLESLQRLTQICCHHPASGHCGAGYCRAGYCRSWYCRSWYCRAEYYRSRYYCWSWGCSLSRRRLGVSENI